ncbi:MAG: hypothetical protein QGM50_06850 [Anaerolineae bacterium]|nr:hypothetical protein [Anaerolineae bacterium]MDK1081627.1 hypothetical protein [Anaerolineae bacterium]MDK1118496.1 hypothetical protein [Anaerolineae bacterium]
MNTACRDFRKLAVIITDYQLYTPSNHDQSNPPGTRAIANALHLAITDKPKIRRLPSVPTLASASKPSGRYLFQ